MDNYIIPVAEPVDTVSGCGWAFLVFLLIVIVVLLAIFGCAQTDDELNEDIERMTNINLRKLYKKMKLNEKFTVLPPRVFKRQYLSTPYKPFIGMDYPTPNPVSLRSGLRVPSPPKYECEYAWRDCNAYQDCIENQCVAKNYPYVS